MMNKENQAEIAGLFDELLGKKGGETFAIERSYPADAAKKAWAGKKIAHQVEIKAVYELKKPELDEAFLKSMGLKSAEEFKRKLKEEYEHHQEHQKDEKILDGIYEKLLEASPFPGAALPGGTGGGPAPDPEPPPLNFKNDEEKNQFREMLFAQAEKAVRLSLMLEQVRSTHHIEVNAQDLDKEYAHLALAPLRSRKGDPQILRRGKKGGRAEGPPAQRQDQRIHQGKNQDQRGITCHSFPWSSSRRGTSNGPMTSIPGC